MLDIRHANICILASISLLIQKVGHLHPFCVCVFPSSISALYFPLIYNIFIYNTIWRFPNLGVPPVIIQVIPSKKRQASSGSQQAGVESASTPHVYVLQGDTAKAEKRHSRKSSPGRSIHRLAPFPNRKPWNLRLCLPGKRGAGQNANF